MFLRGLGATLIVALGVGCATTDSRVTKVDRFRNTVSVASSGDVRSALPKPQRDAEVRASIRELTARVAKRATKKDLLNLAQLHLLAGNSEQAVKRCRQVLRGDLDNVVARKILAQAAVREGKYDLAGIILSRIGGADSRDSEVVNMLAMVELEKGKKARAMALFKRAVELDPNNISARMNLGVQFVKYRRLTDAARQFERVLNAVPQHTDAKMHLAIIKTAIGKYDQAEEIYEDILDREEDNPLALYNLAIVQKKAGDYDAALDNLKAYLKTDYARQRTNGDRVFALIDEIQRNSQDEDRISDDEIREIAAGLDNGGALRAEGAPTTTPAPSNTLSEDDDIAELERMLQ